ncbi:MAG TPA: molybdopterin-binding protein, partial [Bacteroidia bacterium]|nr:molybdopterin-binding protein [Bacteroidia bacterium]
TLFYKVAQKPGKPLYFGRNKNCFVFGLPGNPASALTCFYEYVYPTLRIMQGKESIFLNSLELPALKNMVKKKGLAHFLKAEIKYDGVMPLDGQESFIMKSMAGAGVFIYLPADKENVAEGELVEVHVLPNF